MRRRSEQRGVDRKEERVRLLTGVEALNGPIPIGWSASFTYLAMERYRPMHGKAHAHRGACVRAADPAPIRDGLLPRSPER